MINNSFVTMIKNFAKQNLPVMMTTGKEALVKGKNKVDEISIKQKISNKYMKIGQTIYTKKLRINNLSIKKELENIASLYMEIENNNKLIQKIQKG